ncbi:hypothetical protein [Oceanidesulfovibrio indonesiensis]|uniref:hypothetical protein n=1 Tax=Oceanidesulfovibrio indonesiensis TaxID=54767 RepID=UPI0014315C76|nr:hypothetical protein [Oceanidesulfovibrio indonesiensis]
MTSTAAPRQPFDIPCSFVDVLLSLSKFSATQKRGCFSAALFPARIANLSAFTPEQSLPRCWFELPAYGDES